MAFQSSTATNSADLWSQLLSFLTTNSSLVAAGDAWTIVWSGTGIYGGGLHTDGVRRTDVVIKGPGLTGSDEVYVALRLYVNEVADYHAIYIRGCTGILTGALQYDQHVNMSKAVVMFCDSNPVSYWFVANGRRFIVVQKITTVFEAMYAGLYLPYAFPTTYPYPLFIGGSATSRILLSGGWRSTSVLHSHFTDPYQVDTASEPGRNPSATFITPEGVWQDVINAGNASPSDWSSLLPLSGGEAFGAKDVVSPVTDTSPGYRRMLKPLRTAFGGDMILTPFTIVRRAGGETTYGILDGVYHCPGVGNGAQNIITVGGVDHLVVQNAFRTETDDYWALKLE